MQINSEQYRLARDGWFYTHKQTHAGDELILNMPTPRGRRILPVGYVAEVKSLGFGRSMVRAERLENVEGIY